MFQPSDTNGNSQEQSVTEQPTSGTKAEEVNGQSDANETEQSSSSEAPVANETQPEVSKESRHFSRKINKEIDKRVDLALDVIEDNPDYIYRLAERDPDVADRIIREDSSSFGGAKSAKELLQKKQLDEGGEEGVKQLTLQQQDRIDRIEMQQKETRLRELKRVHPDLEGELEEEFLRMDSNTYFDRFGDDAKVDMARAALGKTSPDMSDADSVAADMLSQREGSTISRRSSPQGKNRQEQETPEVVRTRQAFRNEPGDEEKYLTAEEREYIDREFA